MGIVSIAKKYQYTHLLEKLAREKASLQDLDEASLAYKKFCYDNNLSDDLVWKNLIGEKLIIPVEIKRNYLDINEVVRACDNLKNAISSHEGISMKDANLILEWSINNAYYAIHDDSSFDNSIFYLHLSEYFIQAVLALPFIDANVPITINSTKHFNDGASSHPFITVKLPIQVNDEIVWKQFLIDPTYIYYFLFINANAGILYENKSKFKSPAAGFYVCKSNEGQEFAVELIQNGFIELTLNNARLYGAGFECEKLNLINYNDWEKIMAKSGSEYLNIINSKQEELLYGPENIEVYEFRTEFPSVVKSKR